MKLKEICDNHGLTPEGVDFALRQYQTIVSEITHGWLSKLTYDAKYVLQTAQERWCDTCDLKLALYEEGFHDGYNQAMREMHPCRECQEFSCDGCRHKPEKMKGESWDG